MVEPSPTQRGQQRFDRGYGDEQEKRFPRTVTDKDARFPFSDDVDGKRDLKRVDDKRPNHFNLVTADEMKLKAEARAKAKLNRPPRTAGVLYRYDENGKLERVLSQAEKNEFAEKEESRRTEKELREKEKKKLEKIKAAHVIAAPTPAEIIDTSVEIEQHGVEGEDEVEVPVNPSEEHELDPEYLEQLEISSDDARQLSIEFVEVKSKRAITLEKKDVKVKDPVPTSLATTLTTIPPPSATSSRTSEKPSKKSTIEVIPPEDSPRPVLKPAWQAPHATLEVLGVPVAATASSPADTSPAEESEPNGAGAVSVSKPNRFDKRERRGKDRDRDRERDAPKWTRKTRDDGIEEPRSETSRRGTGRVDSSAAKIHLLGNATSRHRSSRSEHHEKQQEGESKQEMTIASLPSTSAADEKRESQDLKVHSEDQDGVDAPMGSSTRGRGGRGRGRGSRRGGREGRSSGREVAADVSPQGGETRSTEHTATRRPSLDERRGGRRGGLKERGPPLSRERITRGPPAQNPNPE
jgi:hypothetical protein